jgi:hypothetical protein
MFWHTRKEVQKSRQGEEDLCADPLHGTEFDTVSVLWKVDIEHREFLVMVLERLLK